MLYNPPHPESRDLTQSNPVQSTCRVPTLTYYLELGEEEGEGGHFRSPKIVTDLCIIYNSDHFPHILSLFFTISLRPFLGQQMRVSGEKAAFTLTVESLGHSWCCLLSAAPPQVDNLGSPWEGSSTVRISYSRWMTTP